MAKLVVLLTVVVVALAQQEYPPPVKWDRMSITWRPGNGSPNQDAFFNVPVNLNTQARSGFREVFEDSGCMATPTRPYFGRVFIEGGCGGANGTVKGWWAFRLLVDIRNYVVGVQAMVKATSFTPPPSTGTAANYWSKCTDACDNTPAWCATAYTVYPYIQQNNTDPNSDHKLYPVRNVTAGVDICRYGRYQQDAQNSPVGTGFWLTTLGNNPSPDDFPNVSNPKTFNDKNFQYVPYRQMDATSGGFMPGQCFSSQGVNYFYGYNSSAMNCTDIIPYIALYNGGRLNAFAFFFPGIPSNARWEVPPSFGYYPQIFSPTIGPPSCLYTNANWTNPGSPPTPNVQMLHVYFSANPRSNARC